MSPEQLKPSEVTRILEAADAGDSGALEKLFPLVYEELHAVAERQFRKERSGHTLQPTALVHEVYVKLTQDGAGEAKCRAHFVALAAKVMRQVLVDHHRKRVAAKRGGAAVRITLDSSLQGAEAGTLDAIALEEALEKLAAIDKRKCTVVELRVFGGLSVEEAAAALQVSTRTVEADWHMARAWLQVELSGDGKRSPS
ncbi:MAG TPA: sigma-70 family RNA polymerase sigma factor [Planctomycetota bacterium]|nr:sigma-70 family RNA polymerase sigma factor [Planctomycetota bacterium]